MSPLRPRAAVSADLPAIVALDAACFGNPWSLDVYREELERPLGRLRVTEDEHGLVGLACTWIVADEAHLLRIVTAARARRRGHARTLLQAVIAEAAAAACQQLLLEVAAGNAAAVGLYTAFGFQPIARRRGYYAHPPDDALVMRCVLADSIPRPAS